MTIPVLALLAVRACQSDSVLVIDCDRVTMPILRKEEERMILADEQYNEAVHAELQVKERVFTHLAQQKSITFHGEKDQDVSFKQSRQVVEGICGGLRRLRFRCSS